MQRKNNLLGLSQLHKRTSSSILSSGKFFFTKKIPSRQSRGFAMIMAVVVMIVVATIMAFTLNQTTQTAKRTADMYLYEQVELHAKSAIEYALFVIASDGCQNSLVFDIDTMYDVNITMQYVYTQARVNTAGIACAQYIGGANPDDFIQTPEQDGSVLMDVRISVDGANGGTEPITYFRRTIQKL